GLLGLLEALFRLLRPVTLVAVGVVLHRELAISLLDLVLAGVLRHSQDVVVIALCHRSCPSCARCRVPTRTPRGHADGVWQAPARRIATGAEAPVRSLACSLTSGPSLP